MVYTNEKVMQDRADNLDFETVLEMEKTGKITQEDPERSASQTLENPSSMAEQRRDILRETQWCFTGFTEAVLAYRFKGTI